MFLLLGSLLVLADACVRTSDTSTTTTTIATTISCTGCNPATVVPQADPDDPVNGHPPAPYIVGVDAATGCSSLLIQCFPVAPQTVSFLTLVSNGVNTGFFPGSQGNPGKATLICNTAGQWIFTANNAMGVPTSLPIQAAECLG